MLDRELGKDIALEERAGFLKDNCDAVEQVTYSRAFEPEELALKREQLTDASIKIADIEEEKKEVMDSFKERLKPLQEEKEEAIKALRDKSQTVTEECYKFLDEETKMVGFYNKEGNLVSSRPAFQKELQRTIQMQIRKDGTND
jgi:translation initiation factor 2 beta subunit (eIF-2beta)/eIF-5